MFGAKTRRIRELETLLDTQQRRLDRVEGELTTHQTNAGIALDRRVQADTRTAGFQTELAAAQSANRRLHETVTALEKRLADLQAANEKHDADLAKPADTTQPAEIPQQREDGAA